MFNRNFMKCVLGLVLTLPSVVGFADGVRAERRGICYDRQHAASLVEQLYGAALFRSPEPAALNTWSRVVRLRGYEGLLEVARGIGLSDEFRNVTRQNFSDEQIIHSLYLGLLARTPDSASFGIWIQRLNNGEDVVTGFVASTEFRQVNLENCN